jgi:hypothetical protein
MMTPPLDGDNEWHRLPDDKLSWQWRLLDNKLLLNGDNERRRPPGRFVIRFPSAFAVVDDNRANSRNDDNVEIILLVEEGIPPLPMMIKVDAGNNGNVENRPPLPSPSSSSLSSSSLSLLGDGRFMTTTSSKE